MIHNTIYQLSARVNYICITRRVSSVR